MTSYNEEATKRLEEHMYMGVPGCALTDLKEGADINIVNQHGGTVLHFACSYSFWPLVEKCLEAGMDVNAKNKAGDSPLSCITGSPESSAEGIVRVLLKSGADPNISHALHNAAYQGNNAIIKCLWEFGADMGVLDKNGRTASLLASMNGQMHTSMLIDSLRKAS